MSRTVENYLSTQSIPQNPNATLPSLTAGGQTYTNTADVTKYLVQNAKNKVKTGSSLIDKIHEDLYDPNFPLLLAVSPAAYRCHPFLFLTVLPISGTTKSSMRRQVVSSATFCPTVSESLSLFYLTTNIASIQAKMLWIDILQLRMPLRTRSSTTTSSRKTVMSCQSTNPRPPIM